MQAGLGDSMMNLARGVGERVSSLAGGLMTTAGAVPQALERRFPLGGIRFDDGLEFVGGEEYASRQAATETPDLSEIFVGTGAAAQERDLGYEPMTTWENVKDVEGVLPTLMEGTKFALEQGVVSLPDMAAALANLPAYMTARAGEIAKARANLRGEEEINEEDLAIAGGTALLSSLLERYGAEKVLGSLKGLDATVLRRIFTAATAEAGTEAAQEGLEYGAERVGQAPMALGELGDRMAAGAVGGAGAGAAIRGGAETAVGAARLVSPPQELPADLGSLMQQPEIPALPAPTITVDPQGQAGTQVQREAAAAESAELGMTPGTIRAAMEQARREAEMRPPPVEPLALPPPDTKPEIVQPAPLQNLAESVETVIPEAPEPEMASPIAPSDAIEGGGATQVRPGTESRPATDDKTAALRTLAQQAGWAEVGGKMIRSGAQTEGGLVGEGQGDVIGRTPWIPKAEWWPGRPGGFNESQTAAIIEKGINGNLLGKKQREYFDFLSELADEMVASSAFNPTSDELAAEQFESGPDDGFEAALVARATELDENAAERAAQQFEDDDAGFLRAIKAIVDQPREAPTESRQGGARSEKADLFGQDTSQAQEIADEQRRVDERLAPDRDVPLETGRPDDLFSESRKQRDIEDAPASESPVPEKFSDFARQRWGPNWAIARPTERNLERYGRLITNSEYKKAEAEWKGALEEQKAAEPQTSEGIEVQELSPERLTPEQRKAFGGLKQRRDEGRAESQLDTELTRQSAEEGQQDAETRGLRDAVRSVLGEADTVEFVADVNGVPAEIRKRMKRSPGTTWKGSFDPKTGRVFIASSAATDPADAAWTAAHEIAGHKGLRGSIGANDIDALNNAFRIARQNPTVDRLATEMKRQRTKLGEMTSVEEALAELAAATRTGDYAHIKDRYGIDVPQAQRDTLRGAIERFIQRIKALFGKRGAKFSDEQVRDLLEGAWRYVSEGESSRSEGDATLSEVEPESTLLRKRIRKLDKKIEHELVVSGGERTQKIRSMIAESARIGERADAVDFGDAQLSEAVAERRTTPPSQKGDKGYAKAAQRAIDIWNEKIGWRYGVLGKLPAKKTYLKERYLALGKVGESQEIGHGVFKALSKADESDQQAVYAYMTTRDAKPSSIKDDAIRAQAVKVKGLIDRVGKRLVEAGLLSKEAYEAHAGEYLPRVYLKHLLGEKNFSAIGNGKRLSDLGYTKQRMDIPEDVRKVILGEITDPAFLASFGLTRTLRDLAIVDFLQTVAGNRKWTPAGAVVEWNGRSVSPFWLQAEAQRLRKQAQYQTADVAEKARKLAERMDKEAHDAEEALGDVGGDFQQVPNSPRYGALRGLWVRKEIFDDLVGAQNFIPREAGWAESLLGQGGTLTKLTQWWKMSKVALNPPSQIRNFASNMALLHLSGVPAHRVYSGEIVGKAIKSIIKKDRYYQIAKKYGLFSVTFSNQELRRIEDSWIALQKKQGTGVARLKAMGAEFANLAGDTYALMEAVGKIAKLRDAMGREGKSEADAMIEAHEALFDYSLVPRSIQYLRNAPIGSAFITFTYKVLPQLAKTAVKHPMRFAPYVAVPYILQEIVKSSFDVDDDDVEKLRKAFPNWIEERGHMLLMPFKDEDGRWQVVNLGYILPWGAFTNAYKTAKAGKPLEALRDIGLLSGPIPDVIAAIKTNIDPFTKREIVNPADPPAEQLQQLLTYVWNLAMPSFMGIGQDQRQGGALSRMKDALSGKVNPRTGDPRDTPTQAAMRFFGVNVYPVEPEKTRAANLRGMKFELDEIRSRMREQLRDRNLTDDDRANIRRVYSALGKAQAERIQRYREDSAIHPNMRTAQDEIEEP
jgi:hypothetical protein